MDVLHTGISQMESRQIDFAIIAAEGFYAQYNNQLSIALPELTMMVQDSLDAIGDEHEYHHISHVLETLQAVMQDAAMCETNGTAVSRRLLVAAALFHDANYHEDHINLGYDSKEAYAADVFARMAPNYDFTDIEVAGVQSIIMATKLGIVPRTPEQKIMVRADIANVAESYESFLAKNTAMLDETKQKQAYNELSTELERQNFIRTFEDGSLRVLCAYLINDLSLGNFDDNFMYIASNNLYRYAEAIATSRGIANAPIYIGSLKDSNVNTVLFGENLFPKPIS